MFTYLLRHVAASNKDELNNIAITGYTCRHALRFIFHNPNIIFNNLYKQ